MITVLLLLDIFIVILGLCIGSFLNCVLYRLEKNESFVKGRSYCPHCKHSLSWLDLIPVASFLFLQGACRYCNKKISIQYPLLEIATGLLFLLIFNFQLSAINAFSVPVFIQLLFLLYIASSLIVIFVYDLKHYLIPDSVLFPAIAVSFLYRLFENVFYFPHYLLAAFIASGFFLGIFLLSKGKWMGFGDVKLALLLGLLLGFPNILVGLFLSFFFGAIIGLILMYFKKKGLKSEVPFAPFLIVGTFVALFFGDAIIQWYIHLFLF